MRVKELKILLNALDGNTEVMLCNHHLENKPIVDVNISLVGKKDTTRIVLILAEDRL